MDLIRFRRVKALFEVLSDSPPGERERLLEDLCPDDPEVRNLVVKMLEDPLQT
jgi:hypothetical protein